MQVQTPILEDARNALHLVRNLPGLNANKIYLTMGANESHFWNVSCDDIKTRHIAPVLRRHPVGRGARPARRSTLATDVICCLDPAESLEANEDCIRNTVEFIHRNIHLPINLEKLFDMASMPEQTFVRHFVEKIGIKPQSFIDRCRVERASSLLRRRKKRSLKEIAASSGFGDVRKLRAVFRRLTGTTPTLYRRNRV
jgi:transcriptional regulator GlxA family with amidase domain